jgi:tape measure domain-containing protein
MAAKDIEAGRAHVLIRLRDQVSGSLKKVERNFSAFGRSFATAGAALTAAGAGALAFPLMLAANMETLEVNFEVMLGSAEAAKKMLADLSDFAKKTPFGLADLSRNAELLLNYKLDAEKVLPTLNALGNAAAGDSEKLNRLALAFGQATAKTKLMGGEAMQMTEAGLNPLQIIAEATGRTIPELTDAMSKGAISADLLASSLEYVYGPAGRLGSQMEKASGTTLGLVSTLMDAVSFGFKPIGDAAIAVLKPLVKFSIGAADAFSAFMTANTGLAKAISYVLIGMVAVGSILTVVGLAVMAMGSLFGTAAFIISAVSSAIATLFSPLGLALLGLTALAMAAYHFRDAIYTALVAAADYFRPLTDAIGRVWSVFRETFDGIVLALQSGLLAQAAGIAWLGFVAAAWQGVAELGGAMEMALDMITAILPGVDSFSRYVTDAFGAIGQAILAGRWDLGVAIAMAKIKLAVHSGLSAVSLAWSSFTIGLATVWEDIVLSIKSTWRTAVTEIAKSFIWVAERFGFAMDGVREELDRMRTSDQRADEKAKSGRDAARYAEAQKMIERNKARGDELRGDVSSLEQQSNEAFAAAGAPTIEDIAGDARDELRKQIEKLKQEIEDLKKKTADSPLANQASSASNLLTKISSAGTFSAAGAAQALGVDTTAANQTAANTKKMVQLMQQQKAQPLFT